VFIIGFYKQQQTHSTFSKTKALVHRVKGFDHRQWSRFHAACSSGRCTTHDFTTVLFWSR